MGRQKEREKGKQWTQRMQRKHAAYITKVLKEDERRDGAEIIF